MRVKALRTIKFRHCWHFPGEVLEVGPEVAERLIVAGAAEWMEPAPVSEDHGQDGQATPEPETPKDHGQDGRATSEPETELATEPETSRDHGQDGRATEEDIGGVPVSRAVAAVEKLINQGRVVKSGPNKGRPTVAALEDELSVRDLNSSGRNQAFEAWLARQKA